MISVSVLFQKISLLQIEVLSDDGSMLFASLELKLEMSGLNITQYFKIGLIDIKSENKLAS